MLLFTRILALSVFFVVRLSMSLLPRWFDEAITCHEKQRVGWGEIGVSGRDIMVRQVGRYSCDRRDRQDQLRLYSAMLRCLTTACIRVRTMVAAFFSWP